MSYSSEVLADSPVAWYRLSESSGQPQDSSGNARHTTVTGGSPTYSYPGAISSDATNTAISFSGSGQYFSAADHALLDVGDIFTLEAWVRVPTVVGGGGIRRSIVDKGTNGFWFGLLANGTVQFSKQDVEDGPTGGLIPAANTWFHYVATENSGTPKIYRNGIDITVAGGSPTIESTATVLKIGSSINDQYWEGQLDEVAIYPTALSAPRILAHYTAGIAPKIRSPQLDYDYSRS